MENGPQVPDQEVEALHQRASGHYLQGEFRQALEQWQHLLAIDPADERALEGVRLCRMLCDESAGQLGTSHEQAAPGEPPLEPMGDTLAELDQFLGGSAPAATGLAEASGSASAMAASELRRRVNDLLAEALMAYEAGHKDEALSSLSRVLILDEENEEAVTLLKKIRSELTVDEPPAEASPAAGEQQALDALAAALPAK
ncbi:MAG TPA: hypothetical protein VJS92_14825, partial [Candidatus Polarisedimenticolaceae bacterium]|nr:hypothetical protein [Candidatus Polarisedimenticolaceae bacterium]